MIQNARIAYSVPSITNQPLLPITETSVGPTEVVRHDLDLASNVGCRVATSTQTRGKVTSKLAKVTKHFVSSNPTLMTETPYEVSAHLVIRYDERYTVQENLEQVIGALMNFLLSSEEGNDKPNVLRLAIGEL